MSESHERDQTQWRTTRQRRQRRWMPDLLILLVCLACLAFTTTATAQNPSTSNNNSPQQPQHDPDNAPLELAVDEFVVRVNGEPFFVRGVCYSPASIGTAPAWTPPWGDFFMPQFYDMWARDFPVIRAMGANTIRVWGWNNNADHTLFLNVAHKFGLKVIITFSIGNAYESPVHEEWQRQNILGTFKWQVSRYAHHPAILAWSFGAELNAAWNNFLPVLGDAKWCGWNGAYYPNDPNGCYNRPADDASTCKESIKCVYSALFDFINTAALYAKDALGNQPSHLILGALADVDLVTQRLADFETLAPAVDGWAMQVYRGRDFTQGDSDLLLDYERASSKPLIITEFGVDAYNDPCGDSASSPCYNFAHEPPAGYGEDEETQADWLLHLAAIATNRSSATGRGAVAGACVFEWLDEYWRSTTGVRGCSGPVPYGKPGFDPSLCDWKAHVDCAESDVWYHSLCGWWSAAAPDHYSNQAWYGLMRVHPMPGDIDRIVPRLAYERLKEHWAGPPGTAWMIALGICLVILLVVSLHMYRVWQRRVRELHHVGLSKSLFVLSSSSSPLGGGMVGGVLGGSGVGGAGSGGANGSNIDVSRSVAADETTPLL